ncbi:MAG: tRNA uridine-5-carboxymethylaminomethyl(34) synthesis GTPase MnmE [Bacillales bacterium]|jgi:tRNA modification GTPase|nr:tRNA uridine-5-carboxymethylaminomethyl(34) synthesis GTPase MnmE [Bacillales bacterium]
MSTIVALATPPLTSALAIIRLSGEDAYSIAQKVLKKDLTNITQKTILFGGFYSQNESIDDVISLIYKGPKSFTGEDTIEFICHGSLLIIQQIISTLISLGAVQAERGEFSLRAYLNNKIDLLQAEAINDIIQSQTTLSKNNALAILKGTLSTKINIIREEIRSLLTLLETNIDYPEYYDIKQLTQKDIKPIIDNLILELTELISENKKGILITNGLKVVIIGKPNVGKSTLLNALIQEDKAIVSSIPGTTRDIVEGKVIVNGLLLNLFDTAGIHLTNDEIEDIGINKAKEILNKADLIIYILENDNDNELDYLLTNREYIKVLNKTDIKKSQSNLIQISALTKNIEPLINEIKKKFNLLDSNNVGLLNNTRHLGLINKAYLSLIEVKKLLAETEYLDLITQELNNTYTYFNELIGNINVDISKEIFSSFCVGK